MTDTEKQRAGQWVLDQIGFNGADLLYDADEFHDPERTNADIGEYVIATVREALTRLERGEFKDKEEA